MARQSDSRAVLRPSNRDVLKKCDSTTGGSGTASTASTALRGKWGWGRLKSGAKRQRESLREWWRGFLFQTITLATLA